MQDRASFPFESVGLGDEQDEMQIQSVNVFFRVTKPIDFTHIAARAVGEDGTDQRIWGPTDIASQNEGADWLFVNFNELSPTLRYNVDIIAQDSPINAGTDFDA